MSSWAMAMGSGGSCVILSYYAMSSQMTGGLTSFKVGSGLAGLSHTDIWDTARALYSHATVFFVILIPPIYLIVPDP